MANGINIGIAADTRTAQRGIQQGLIEPLEDSQQQLETLARTAGRSGDAVERAMKDQQQDTQRNAAEYRKLTRTVQTESQQQARAVKSAAHEQTAAGAESMSELKGEAVQNLSETLSSYQGDATSLLGGLQGTFGGIVSSLGPIGMAAGAAGAIGVGLITAAMGTASTDTEALKAKVSELTQALIDTGSTGAPGLDFVVQKLQELATATEGVKLTDLMRDAKGAKEDFKGLAQAYAGNTEAIPELLKRVQEHRAALLEQTRAGYAADQATGKQIDSLKDYAQNLLDAKKAADDAAAAEQAYIQAGGPELEAKAAAAETYASSVQSALEDAGGAWEDFKTKEGGIDLDKYNHMLEQKALAIEKYQVNIQTASSQMSDAALQYIESLGTDAAPLLQQFVDAPAKQKARTAANWDLLGRAASSSYTSGLKNALPASVTGPEVTVPTPNVEDIVARMQGGLNRKTLQVEIGAFLRNGKRVV